MSDRDEQELREKLASMFTDEGGHFEWKLDKILALIDQVSTRRASEAYEQGKNAGHAAQHAKDFEEMDIEARIDELDNHVRLMNGWHPGDWEEAIVARIKELQASLQPTKGSK